MLAISASVYCNTATAAGRSITLNVTSSGCQYVGGDNDAGDVTFHVGTKASVTVHVTGSYTIDNIAIASDPNRQLSIPNPTSPTTTVIQNKNSVAQEATYKVTVKDENGDTIPCDPKIINN